MKLDIAELKRLAASILRESGQSRFRVYIDGHKDWSDFLAACSPQTIRALIERLETLEAERKGTVRLTLEQARYALNAIEYMHGAEGVDPEHSRRSLGRFRAAIKEAEHE